MDTSPETPSESTDAVQIALEIDRAGAENLDWAAAQVAEADMDSIHMEVHAE